MWFLAGSEWSFVYRHGELFSQISVNEKPTLSLSRFRLSVVQRTLEIMKICKFYQLAPYHQKQVWTLRGRLNYIAKKYVVCEYSHWKIFWLNVSFVINWVSQIWIELRSKGLLIANKFQLHLEVSYIMFTSKNWDRNEANAIFIWLNSLSS